MRSFSEVVFDFKRGRIKLVGEWEPVQASVSGLDPMARSKAVTDEVFERQGIMDLMNQGMTMEESELLKQLSGEFPTLLQPNLQPTPNKPLALYVGSTEYLVELTNITPRRTRPRRIPPLWEAKYVDKSTKYARMGHVDLPNLIGPVMSS